MTQSAQKKMLLAAILLVAILMTLGPGLANRGLPVVDSETQLAGLTFCGLAFVQIFSYPFHDPVLTDRAFLTSPKIMLRGFILAGLISGGFILLFSSVGLYALRFGIEDKATLAVPALFGLPMLLAFNAIMLTSAGSTLDSTFSSVAKLTARDWSNRSGRPTESQAYFGRWAMMTVAVLGNLPWIWVSISMDWQSVPWDIFWALSRAKPRRSRQSSQVQLTSESLSQRSV